MMIPERPGKKAREISTSNTSNYFNITLTSRKRFLIKLTSCTRSQSCKQEQFAL